MRNRGKILTAQHSTAQYSVKLAVSFVYDFLEINKKSSRYGYLKKMSVSAAF